MGNRKFKIPLIRKIAISFLLLIILVPSLFLTVDLLTTNSIIPDIVKKAKIKGANILELTDLSAHQLDILLKVEDPNFYHHKGIDIKTPGAGWTTITQSLVKMYYFSNEFKPGFLRFNKIRQSVIASFIFHPKISKNEQLKLYINGAYFGTFAEKSIMGLKEAAREFYHKSFNELQEDEYISLIAVLVAPNSFNPVKNKEENLERVRRIKRLLAGECQPKNFKDVYFE